MAMNPKCATAVRQAAGGRQVSNSKLQAIEDALTLTMKRMALEDRRLPAAQRRWTSMTKAQRIQAAAARAMDELQAEAKLKEHRAALQVLRDTEADTRITEQVALVKGTTRSQGLIRDIENTGSYADSVRNEAVSDLTAMIDAASTKDGTGVMRNLGMRIFDLDNPKMTADVVREVFRNADGHTGNAVAKAGAKAWLDAIEKMRKRFNAAGGNIGKLGYGYLSQAHDAIRLAEAGPDAWAKKVLPLVDREQYVRADGSLMDDAEMLTMLKAAHETLVTGGSNKTDPGQFKGTGARAKRGSDHRVLHFRDGDAWMAYMEEFGQGSLYDSMLGHVSAMARDIALVERYGPNPETTFRKQLDIAQRADGVGTVANRSALNTPEAYWNIATGVTGTPENRVIAQFGQDVRNVQTAAKLGGAVLSSATDLGTVTASLHYNRLPYFQMLANLGKQVTKDQREFLRAHSVIAESLTSSLNRWTGDHLTNSLSGRVAGSVMKLQFMNWWSDTLRGAFSATMMQGFAKKLGKAWNQLDEWDRFLMQRKGITEADWAVISQAKPTERGGVGYLTGAAIREVPDADVMSARQSEISAISERIKAATEELSARNAQDQLWVKSRIAKFDDARDAMNRWVKERAAKRQAGNAEAADAMRARIELLDAQREQAKLQADIESEYNKLFTTADLDAFKLGIDQASMDLTGASSASIKAAEAAGTKFGAARERLNRRIRQLQRHAGAASENADVNTDIQGKRTDKKLEALAERIVKAEERADSTVEADLLKMTAAEAEIVRAALERDITIALKAYPEAERRAFKSAIDGFGEVRKSAGQGMRAAESIGRRYGEAKGRLERRVKEIESKIRSIDRQAGRDADADAKAVQKRADAMSAELKEFIQRSAERQTRRQHVIDRLTREEAPRLAAEAARLREQAATKWMGFVSDEAQFAVVNPDMATRAIVTGGGMPAGTVRGEAMRSFMQFKSFPLAMLTRHWRRIFDTPQGLQGAPIGYGAKTTAGAAVNRVAVLAGLNVTLMMLGAMVLQNKAVISGKDPYDMTEGKFWARALTQGGGLGYVGDLLFKDPTEQRGNTYEQAAGAAFGPAAGAAAGLVGDLGLVNAWELAKGKETNAGAEALRWGNSQLPYASLWYVRPTWEHWFIHNAQEALNPGYLGRMQQRAARDWGQGYWWSPGDAVPDRAPEFDNITGE